jgi:hypothetical protein
MSDHDLRGEQAINGFICAAALIDAGWRLVARSRSIVMAGRESAIYLIQLES